MTAADPLENWLYDVSTRTLPSARVASALFRELNELSHVRLTGELTVHARLSLFSRAFSSF